MMRFFSALMLVALAAPAGAQHEISPLSAKDALALHRSLTPSETPTWRTIPWKISLLDAQRAAIAQKKPIFIWAMDGHPLGCT